MKIAITMTALVIALCGCATMPSPQEIANIDYGPSISVDYKEAIKSLMAESLFDPYAARYRFGAPAQYWVKFPPLRGGGLVAGYAVATKINGKNRMGAYIGYQDYLFIFKNDRIIKTLSPDDVATMSGEATRAMFARVPPEALP